MSAKSKKKLFHKLKNRVTSFRKCRKEALIHLNKGRIDEAMATLHKEGKSSSETDGYMGLEAKTGYDLSK